MRMNAKWLTPVLWSVAIVGTAIAAACGDGSASRSVFSVLDSAGRDSAGDSVPHDTTPPPPPPPPPPDTIPPPPDSGRGPVVRIVLSPRSQQRTVGDTRAVYVTLFDSAGRVVRDSVVTWALGDTTGVLRITFATMSSVMFETVGPGRAQLIARHQALADTAVVIVVADSTPPPPPPPPPPDTVLAPRIVVSPRSQQLVVGDSGVVSATVFDSAGHQINANVAWDLGDTNSVVRVGSVSQSRVSFVAIAPGQAVLIARYRTLADTAVVIVVQSSSPPPDPVTRIIVSPKSQERVVGDSGVVSATLRDAAGRDVWPGEITWESSDTSTVLHIRYVGSSFIVFDALRSATARLIARHRDLADTAVVIVR